jgi:hypothetical protein
LLLSNVTVLLAVIVNDRVIAQRIRGGARGVRSTLDGGSGGICSTLDSGSGSIRDSLDGGSRGVGDGFVGCTARIGQSFTGGLDQRLGIPLFLLLFDNHSSRLVAALNRLVVAYFCRCRYYSSFRKVRQ